MKTIIPNIVIKCIAGWMPPEKLKLSSFVGQFSEKEVNDVIRTTGCEQIYRANAEMKASDMCFHAAEYLFEKSCIDKATVDGLVFVSTTRDWVIPDTAIALQHRLGLSMETLCQDINYGCVGYIYGLLQASSWISCGMCKNVLVLTGEILSPYLNPEAVGSIDASDGATATLVSFGDSDIAIHICSDGSKADRIVLPHGGYLYQDGMGVFTFSIVNAPKSIKSVMELMGLEESDIDIFALHQSNQLVMKNVRMALKSKPEKFPSNIKDYGNTGCSTIPLLLCELYGDNKIEQPKNAVLCAYGVGLSCGSIIADVSNTHFYAPINR